jgi:hypothetical protein
LVDSFPGFYALSRYSYIAMGTLGTPDAIVSEKDFQLMMQAATYDPAYY